MQNQKKRSNLPLIIIGIVLVAALAAIILGVFAGGAAWWYSQSSGDTSAKKTNTSKTPNSDNSAQLYASAPPGAQPPNMLGSPTATVTVEEFADFQCPTCAVVHPISKEIVSAYGSRIKFIFRHLPLVQIHAKAYDAAVAAEAAGLQGKFWDMQNQLFVNQKSWSTAPNHRQLFEEYAQKIGLNLQQFQNDMAGMSAKARVDADMQRARALRIQSTPSFLINGKLVPYEQMSSHMMRQLIDSELQKTQAGGK